MKRRLVDVKEALDRLLLPIESALQNWPEVRLDDPQALALGRGQVVQLGPGPTLSKVNVVDAGGRSLGIAALDADGGLRSRRLFRWAAHA